MWWNAMNGPPDRSRGTDLESHSGDPIVLTTANDLYHYYTAAATLADTLLNRAITPLVVGIYGRWGRGKTTYLDTIKDRIDASSRKTLQIQYSPWNFQLKSFEDVWIALITEFSSQTESTFSDTLRKKLSDINYWRAGKSVLGAGATLLPLFGEGAKKLIEGLPDGVKKTILSSLSKLKRYSMMQ
jgi:hypothetical protein